MYFVNIMAKNSINLFALGLTFEQLSSELLTYFSKWSEEIDNAEPIFDIKGRQLEHVTRDVPHFQSIYALKAAEAKAVVKWLEIFKSQKESRYLKNYNNSPRALGVKEQSIYLQGEKEIIEINQLIVEANLKLQQFEEIVEALKQLSWTCSNIVKLRVAELTDIVI